MSLSVSPSSIKAGSPMSIRLTVANTGNQPKSIHTSTCDPVFEILNGGRDVVAPPSRPCTLSIAPPTVLEPGDDVEIVDTWSGESNTTAAGGQPIYLSPGTYTLRPRVMVAGAGWAYGSEMKVTIAP
jgi:hypothetical protein